MTANFHLQHQHVMIMMYRAVTFNFVKLIKQFKY